MAALSYIRSRIEAMKQSISDASISPNTLGSLLDDIVSELHNESASMIRSLKHPVSVRSTSAADLIIADEDEHPLLTFASGHIQTQKFDSASVLRKIASFDTINAQITDIINDIAFIKSEVSKWQFPITTKKSYEYPDLVIADEQQYPIATFDQGHIKTRLFDSSKVPMAQRARIRHMHWNIGNFSKGTQASSTVSVESFLLRKAQIIKEFDDYAPDVIAMCEWDNSFTPSVSARSALLSRFEYTAIGPTCADYIGTCISGSIPIQSQKEISLPGGYTALEVTAVICGMTVKIVECHCPWQSADINLQAHRQLIARYGSEPRVIISGDFNIPSDSEQYFATLWAAAGFKMANWKDATFRTGFKCLHGSWALDNCFVRGGSILAARAIQHTPVGISPDDPGIETFQQWAEVNASDHFPVITDIVFNP